MNIKHIVYMFFFVALMGVISEKSEAITIINNSNRTVFVDFCMKQYDNGQVIGESKYGSYFLPGEVKDTHLSAGVNEAEVSLKIFNDKLGWFLEIWKHIIDDNEIIKIDNEIRKITSFFNFDIDEEENNF